MRQALLFLDHDWSVSSVQFFNESDSIIVLIIKATASMFRPRFCNQMLCTNISSSTFFSPSLSKPLCNYVLFGMHVVQTIGWILIKHTVSPSHILFDSLFRSFFIICQYVNPILYVQHNRTFWHSM